MSTTTLASTDDAYAERWRLWQLANAESNRRTAAQARIVFAVIFIALTGLVGLLLSSQLWALQDGRL